MIERMLGAALLNPKAFEAVEADQSATKQALIIVVLASIATSIGSPNTTIGIATNISGIFLAVIGWAIWAWITYFVGTKLLRTEATEANWGELARTLGFAQSPGLFKVFGVLPIIGPYIFITAVFWQLAAHIIAIRQALDYTSTLRAILVALIGFLPYVVLMSILYSLLGGA
jgi:hypothetical protein